MGKLIEIFSLFQFSINEKERRSIRCLRTKRYQVIEFNSGNVGNAIEAKIMNMTSN